MSNKPNYILQKDLPNIPAGTEVEWNDTSTWIGGQYKGGRYGVFEMPSEKSCTQIWTCDDVENNPEWFKLKEEEPPIEITISLKQVKDGVEHRETFQTDYQEPLFRASIYDNIVKMRKRMEEKSTPKEDKVEVCNIQDRSYSFSGCKVNLYAIETSKQIPPEKYEALKESIGFVLNNDSYYMKAYPAEKLYSETQLLGAEQKAFYAAKETLPFPEYQREVADIPHAKVKYPDKYKTFEDYKNQTLNTLNTNT